MEWTKTQKRIVAGLLGLLVIIGLILVYMWLYGWSGSTPGRSTAEGDLKVVAERVSNHDATQAFKFKHVPSPGNPNAARNARFMVIAGVSDGNGGGMRPFYNESLPGGPDSPSDNFFFRDDDDGGRILVALLRASDIQQINTYSWHTGDRAPQVYKLYASDGTEPGFKIRPDNAADPAMFGWKLLADVDTRPTSGKLGGQYGVSITSSKGLIGHYQFLLFAIHRTEKIDRWCNTFYSKIEVVTKGQAAP